MTEDEAAEIITKYIWAFYGRRPITEIASTTELTVEQVRQVAATRPLPSLPVNYFRVVRKVRKSTIFDAYGPPC